MRRNILRPLIPISGLLTLALGCVPGGTLSGGSDDPPGGDDILRIDPTADAGPADVGADGAMGDADPSVDALPAPDPEPEPEPGPPEPEPEPPDPEPQPEPEPPEPEPPLDPCDGVMCVLNAACIDGECACEPGFVADGDTCVAPERSPLQDRSPQEVCARWNTDRIAVPEGWAPADGGGECDPGTITAAAQSNALRRTNLFRWLAGADPVVTDMNLVEQQQRCAALQVALGRLNHQPDDNAPCYTAAGAAGAGSSNLAQGAGVADSVDLYVGDRGVASLGHRRWVLNPTAQTTAFGWKARFSCMYSFSSGRRHEVAVMAWPPPGPVPVDIPRGVFSVQLYGVAPGPDFTISVGIDGAPPAPVAATVLPVGFGGRAPTYAFNPGNVFAAGRSVEVVLDGLSNSGPVAWTTDFVDCR